MNQSKTDKPILNLNLVIIPVMLLGLLSLFLIQINHIIDVSLVIYLSWILVCLLACAFVSHEKNNSSDFDFYKAKASATPETSENKKYKTEDRIGIYIDQDGLDPMVIFNEDKSGVVSIVKLMGLPATNKLTEYSSELEITTQQLGNPIESQTLLKLSFNGVNAYCRLTDDDDHQMIEFAFPKDSTDIYLQVLKAIEMLIEEYPGLTVLEVDVLNYQALLKFYNYVQRLSGEENRSIEYISHYRGNLKICNSSYVELYDCTLQSTLTSWINQDGLIRTDNVDLQKDEQIHLVNIDLPYEQCRLVNIQLGNTESSELVVMLYFTFAELIDGELTDNRSGFTLVMTNDSIEIKRDEVSNEAFISIKEYFEQKCYSKFE